MNSLMLKSGTLLSMKRKELSSIYMGNRGLLNMNNRCGLVFSAKTSTSCLVFSAKSNRSSAKFKITASASKEDYTDLEDPKETVHQTLVNLMSLKMSGYQLECKFKRLLEWACSKWEMHDINAVLDQIISLVADCLTYLINVEHLVPPLFSILNNCAEAPAADVFQAHHLCAEAVNQLKTSLLAFLIKAIKRKESFSAVENLKHDALQKAKVACEELLLNQTDLLEDYTSWMANLGDLALLVENACKQVKNAATDGAN